MGKGDCCPSLASPVSRRHPVASARLASSALEYQCPPLGIGFRNRQSRSQALHSLENMDRVGIVYAMRIIVDLPEDSGVANRRRVERCRSPHQAPRWRSSLRPRHLDHNHRGRQPRRPHRSLARDAAHVFEQRTDMRRLLGGLARNFGLPARPGRLGVRELRKTGAPALTGIPGATLEIGGIPALNADYQTIVEQHLPSVTALVVGATLLALLAGFRSLFAAVKAIVLNLVSVAAAFGALVLVFQDGHGSRLLGVPGGTGSIFPLVPIVAFAIVFGLSMDYEVFLVARVLEARRAGLSEEDAIPEGMARTAGLITSAAAIMIVVFAAFTFGNFLVVKMIGFTLAVAVLIDATLVRIVIGPALLRIARRLELVAWRTPAAKPGERKTLVISNRE